MKFKKLTGAPNFELAPYVKEYLQKIGAKEALYNPSDDDEAGLLEEIVLKMAEMTPEAAGQDISSYYLN